MNEEINKGTCHGASVQGVAGETALQTFTFNPGNQPVRVEIIGGEPWFVVKDLCDILKHSNHKVAIQPLDEDEVRKVYLTDSLGRQQETLLVSESGMYSLIIRSNKQEAKVFRKWVTGEVLPSIRKTGSYSVRQHGEYVVIPEHVKKQWLARAEESAYRRFRLEGCKEMVEGGEL